MSAELSGTVYGAFMDNFFRRGQSDIIGDNIRICPKRSHHAILNHSTAQAENRKLKDKTHTEKVTVENPRT